MTSKRATLGVRHRDAALESGDTSPQSKWRPYPKYKDSGVEWLGEIPAHWDVKPFKALLSRNDSGVWGEDFAEDGIVVLRSTEQTRDGKWNIENPAKRRLKTRESFDALLEEGDLVVTKSSGSELHIGKTSIVDKSVSALNCCFSNFMQRLRVAWPNPSRFYWYLMNCPVAREQLIFLSSTTTGLGNLNGAILGNIQVPVASENEQRTIASFLDRETVKIDALIEKKERLIELLQEKRTALITQAVTKGLDPTVPMKASGLEWLGEIPSHWTITKLKYVAPLQGGYAFKSTDFKSDGIPIVRMNNLKRGFINLNDAVRVDESECLNAFSLKNGDLLLGMSGSLGETGSLGNYAIVRQDDLPCQINQRVGRFIIANDLSRDFLLFFLSATPFTEPIIADSTGTAQFNISPERVGALALGLPQIKEQRNIADFLTRETAKTDALVAKIHVAIDRLKEYRTALISAAVTGKIDVRGEVVQ